MGMSLLASPIIIAFCRRKSTRLTAVMGGLVTALGCLFTSFASQFHQLFLSYGLVVGKCNLIKNANCVNIIYICFVVSRSSGDPEGTGPNSTQGITERSYHFFLLDRYIFCQGPTRVSSTFVDSSKEIVYFVLI